MENNSPQAHHSVSSDEALAQLQAISDSRSALADRLVTPPWYHPALAGLIFVFVAGTSSSRWSSLTFSLFSAGLAGLVLAVPTGHRGLGQRVEQHWRARVCRHVVRRALRCCGRCVDGASRCPSVVVGVRCGCCRSGSCCVGRATVRLVPARSSAGHAVTGHAPAALDGLLAGPSGCRSADPWPPSMTWSLALSVTFSEWPTRSCPNTSRPSTKRVYVVTSKHKAPTGRPRTWVRLTREGRSALARHIAELRRLAHDAIVMAPPAPESAGEVDAFSSTEPVVGQAGS